MEFCIEAKDLRAALAEIEAAEKNGFMHCLAVFRITRAGETISECRARYTDLVERAGDTPDLSWGRFQAVTKRHKYQNGKLVPIPR